MRRNCFNIAIIIGKARATFLDRARQRHLLTILTSYGSSSSWSSPPTTCSVRPYPRRWRRHSWCWCVRGHISFSWSVAWLRRCFGLLRALMRIRGSPRLKSKRIRIQMLGTPSLRSSYMRWNQERNFSRQKWERKVRVCQKQLSTSIPKKCFQQGGCHSNEITRTSPPIMYSAISLIARHL